MQNVLFFGRMDAAELVFYIFVAFFIGLVIWLRREDRREGYPLEMDVSGALLRNDGLLQTALPKTFHLPFDQGTVVQPNDQRDPFVVPNARRTAKWAGSPLEPIGDGIGAGVGPGAYAQRSDFADVSHDGKPRIVPIGEAEMIVATQDADPRGMAMLGADGVEAGKVTDIWVDRSEMMIRYLEVSIGKSSVLVPMTMVLVNGSTKSVHCSALNGGQFAGCPGIKTKGQITRLEEEKIIGYFGSGYLYATPERAEPLI